MGEAEIEIGTKVDLTGFKQGMNQMADGVTNATNKMKKKFGKTFDNKKIKKSFKDIKKGLSDAFNNTKLGQFSNKMTELTGVSLGTAAAVGGVALAIGTVAIASVGFTKGVIRMAGALDQLAKRNGVSAKTVGTLQGVVSKLGGEFEDTADLIDDFTEKFGDAKADPKGTYAQSFKALGVDINKSVDEGLSQAFKTLHTMDAETAQFRGIELFGDKYKVVSATVQAESDLMAKTSPFSPSLIKDAGNIIKKFQNFSSIIKGEMTKAVTPFIALISDLFDTFDNDGISRFGKTIGIVMQWSLKIMIYFVKGIDRLMSNINTAINGSIVMVFALASGFTALAKNALKAASWIEKVLTPKKYESTYWDDMAKELEDVENGLDKMAQSAADIMNTEEDAAEKRGKLYTDYILGIKTARKEQDKLTKSIAKTKKEEDDDKSPTTKTPKAAAPAGKSDKDIAIENAIKNEAILSALNDSRIAKMAQGKAKLLAQLNEDERELGAEKALYILENGAISNDAVAETFQNRLDLINQEKAKLNETAKEGAGRTMAAIFGLDPDVPISEQAGALTAGIINQVGQLASAASDIMSSIFQKRNTERNNEMNALKKYHSEELKNYKGSGAQKIALEKKQKEEERKLAKEAFDKEKKQKKAQVHISMAMGIMGAWSSAMMLPFPASVIVGAANSALITGVSIAQLAAINAEEFQFANGGFVPGNSRTGDKVKAGLNSDEVVLNTTQQKNFMAVANGQTTESELNDRRIAMASTPRHGFSINVENLSGSDDDLQKLEDKIIELQSSGRLEIY